MEALIIGIAAGFNFLIIKWKIEKGRYSDAVLDGFLLFLLAVMFGQTLGGMIIATIGSAMVSLALLANPPKLPSIDSDFIKEFKSKLPQR